MTESYDPYQNAIAERINGILKQEFLINNQKIDLGKMQKIVKQSITIYNTKRPHLFCSMLTPQQMHKQSNIKIKTSKKKENLSANYGLLRDFVILILMKTVTVI